MSDTPATQQIELHPPPTSERASPRTVAVTSSVLFGVHFVEAVSVNLLPLTLYLFTQNAFFIGLILAINPIFGFIAQPIVGVLSDRTWTRVGRRAFYFIVAAPIVALTEVAMPFTTALWLVVVLVVVMQFFADVIIGAHHPLLAEMVPPPQRTFVAGVNLAAAQLGWIVVLFVGMPWVTRYREGHGDELYGLPLYFLAAGVLLVFVMLVAFLLKEKRLDALKPRARLTPGQYIRDFVEHPMLLRLGFVNMLRSLQRTAIAGFVALYATKTLLFEEAEFGQSWGYMPFIALVFALPVSLVMTRLNRQRTLILSFAVMIVCSAIGYIADTPSMLLVAAVCFGLADVLMYTGHATLCTDYFVRGMIGQQATTMNIFYGVGRTVGLVLVGATINYVFDNDYSVIWPISGVLAVVGILVLLGVRDVRHEDARRAGGAPAG
ncbi:MAG: SLC45 family MFS transporter [Gammaproteobacteria bacterium]|nr:SLC45 family MFS transporter [Gammaproteobacteria bacterium]